MKGKVVVIAITIWLVSFLVVGYFLFFHTTTLSKSFSTTPSVSLLDNTSIPDAAYIAAMKSFDEKTSELNNIDSISQPLRSVEKNRPDSNQRPIIYQSNLDTYENSFTRLDDMEYNSDDFVNWILASMDKDSTEIMKRLQDSATPGSVTYASYKAYKASVSLDMKAIRKNLLEHGLKDPYAKRGASKISKLFKSKILKRATVFFGVGSAILTTESLLFPNLTFWQRIFIPAAIATLLLVLYIVAQSKGIFE
ncbi:hypothetical protein KK083_21425 [Fulvivirgaceae bacterium PWU4]|uniref:Uncharacterized protein n=1 Tax=Chryseosolibacter histidini TaxID=2782349 RepID=A0AAP2GPU5_9BACT|nr:hypothetical protein [Chryseosolibacter histidini]MBT1699473.1 hypothetical protein [Chryseosolibacter histidini]